MSRTQARPLVEARQPVETKHRNEQTTAIARIRTVILPVLRRHAITRAGLFGSVVRGEATPQSDIDILIELDAQASLLDFIGIKLELEDALGKPVDLVEYTAIRPRLRARILREEVPIL